MQERTGGCQCGQVRYRLCGEPLALAVCHCKECQRQSGSAFGMSLTMNQSDVVVEGVLKTFERPSDSGRTVKCAFCPECGTRIYHVPQYRAGMLNIKPGTLDDTSWLAPATQVWTQERQSWLPPMEALRAHTAQPF